MNELSRMWLAAAGEFGARLCRVDDWSRPTPCSEWDVRALVNHVTRGNLNYAALLHGGGSAEFLRLREADALGTDPVGAYRRSVAELTAATEEAGAADRIVDHPLGPRPGWRALGVRTIDTVIHAWDLAEACDGAPVDDAVVRWADARWDEVYADVVHPAFFAPPPRPAVTEESALEAILRRAGRAPRRPGSPSSTG